MPAHRRRAIVLWNAICVTDKGSSSIEFRMVSLVVEYSCDRNGATCLVDGARWDERGAIYTAGEWLAAKHKAQARQNKGWVNIGHKIILKRGDYRVFRVDIGRIILYV